MKRLAYMAVIPMVWSAILSGTIEAREPGAEFLNIAVGGRAAAMGEAFAGAADDPSAIFWNPACLSWTKSTQIMFEHNSWLLDMSQQFVGMASPSTIGHFGIGLLYSSSGSIPMTDEFVSSGEYYANDMALCAAYAGRVSQYVALGFGLKYIHESIAEEHASAVALDLGILLSSPRPGGLKIGISAQNIGSEVKFIEEGDRLPTRLRFAGAYGWNDFTVASQIENNTEGKVGLGVGAEYIILNTLAVRAGYNASQCLSLGAGVVLGSLEVGYASVPNDGSLDSSQRISLGLRF